MLVAVSICLNDDDRLVFVYATGTLTTVLLVLSGIRLPPVLIDTVFEDIVAQSLRQVLSFVSSCTYSNNSRYSNGKMAVKTERERQRERECYCLLFSLSLCTSCVTRKGATFILPVTCPHLTSLLLNCIRPLLLKSQTALLGMCHSVSVINIRNHFIREVLYSAVEMLYDSALYD